jgi:biotin carboxyl carrier protein
MTYISTTNNQAYRIDPGETGQQRGIVFDGKKFTIDWQYLAPLTTDEKGQRTAGGRYSLIIGGHSYEIFARRITKPDEKDSETYEIQVEGQRFEIKVEDERAKLLAGLVKSAAATGEARVQAPMPGLVIGVPLEEGASVTSGQTVIVLEAMKMENDLASPISGIIKEIRVNKGQTVEQGQVLVVIAGE